MFPNEAIDAFGKYWRRRKPWKSIVLHYANDCGFSFAGRRAMEWVARGRDRTATIPRHVGA